MTSIPNAGETLKVLRTFAPVAVPGGTGVVVLYQDYAPIARAANAAFLPVAGIFQAALLLLFLALVPILRRVTQRIRRQMDEIEHRGALRRPDRPAEPHALPLADRQASSVPRARTGPPSSLLL